MASTLIGVSGAAANTGSLTSFTITPTSGGTPAQNDIRIVMGTCGSSTTCTIPAGWTTLFNGVLGSGTLFLAYRIFQATDTNVSFTFSGSTNNGWQCVSVRDVVSLVFNTAGATSSASVVAPTLTPPVAPSLLLTFHAVSATSGANAVTLSTPSGMTQVGFYRPTGTGSGHINLTASQALATTADTGTRTSTSSTAANNRAATIIVASAPINPLQFAPFFR